MVTKRPASFCVLADAELAGLLDRVDGVAAGIGEADDLRARSLRLQQEGGEIGRVERMANGAEHLAPCRPDHIGGVRLERMAEGVVGGEEEPGVAPCLHRSCAGALGERVGVVGPMEAVRRAGFAGQIGRGRARHDIDPVLLAGELLDRERDRRIAEARHHVDLVDIEPLTPGGRGHVCLVLVISEHEVDRLAQYLPAEILDRHSHRGDAARPGEIGIDAGHVVEHRDLDHVVGHLGLAPCRRGAPGRPH